MDLPENFDPTTMGQMVVLDRRAGDLKIIWDRTKPDEVENAKSTFDNDWAGATAGLSDGTSDGSSSYEPLASPPPSYTRPKKNWRLKKGATPQWYKQRQGIRTKAQSGAARVARFRPPGLKAPR
jgi:sec-independent protein translocase protein TatB